VKNHRKVMDNHTKIKKIRISSYIFGIACLLFGVGSFHVIPQFRRILDELLGSDHSFSLISKTIYDYPSIWSLIFVLIGILIIVKDLMTDKRYWDTVLFVIFILYIILLVIGCFEPLTGHGGFGS
jgi:type II secretory pathway component PulF